MRVRIVALVLTAALSLPACQTIGGVQLAGRDAQTRVYPAQAESFCGRNPAICVLGVVVVVGGAVALASGGGGGGSTGGGGY